MPHAVPRLRVAATKGNANLSEHVSGTEGDEIILGDKPSY